MGHSRVKTKQAKKRRRNKIIIVIALALVTVVGCAGAYWHFRIGNYEGVLGGKSAFLKPMLLMNSKYWMSGMLSLKT